MKKRLLLLAVVATLVSCADSLNENETFFDERIFGEWGYVAPIDNIEHPSPSHYFYGLQIFQSKMERLAIQHSSGKIKAIEDSYFSNLEFLKNNQMKVHIRGLNAVLVERITYSFFNDSLILDYGHYQRKFSRVKVDSSIFKPQNSLLKFRHGNNSYTNKPVSSSLSAYASKISENNLLIKGITDGFKITLEIENFTGDGYYRFPDCKAEMWVNNSDAIWGIETDSNSIGEIRISNYNEVQNICSGTFSFTNYNYSNTNDPRYTDVRNGLFIVPIYK
jgi:hypothetical protein